MLASLEGATIREGVRLVYLPDDVKDCSALRCLAPEQFKDRFAAARAASKWLRDVVAVRQAERSLTAWALCADLAGADQILPRVVAAVHGLGVVGEDHVIQLLYRPMARRVTRGA
jgi:hypothetical protein